MPALEAQEKTRHELVVPPGVRRSAPRETALTAAGRALVAAATAIFALAFVVLAAMLRIAVGHAHRPGGSMPIWLPFFASTAVAVFGIVCVVWLTFEKRLVRDGRAAPAIVTKITTHRTSHGGTHWHVHYEFRLLNGRLAAGKSHAWRKTPAVGSAICVVYDPDRPRRSLPYPVRLVRAI